MNIITILQLTEGESEVKTASIFVGGWSRSTIQVQQNSLKKLKR